MSTRMTFEIVVKLGGINCCQVCSGLKVEMEVVEVKVGTSVSKPAWTTEK